MEQRFSQRSLLWFSVFAIVSFLSALCVMPFEFTSLAQPAAAAGLSPALAGCVAVDDSGSNFEASGNLPASDPGPVFQRAEAIRQLASLMASDLPGASPTLSVVFFGSKTLEIDPTSVGTATERTKLARDAGTMSASDLGWTRLTTGIERCLTLLRQSPAGTRRFLVVMSDFVAQDADPQFSFSQQQQEIEQTLVPALEQSKIRVYAIGYGQAVRQSNSQFTALMRALTQPTGGLSATVDPSASSLLLATGQVAADLLGAQFSPGSLRTGDGVTLQSFTVTMPSGVDEAVLTVEHPEDTAATVTIVDAAGIRYQPSTDSPSWTISDLFHQFQIARPLSGTWQVLVEGHGPLRVDRWLVMMSAVTPSVTPYPTPRTAPTVVSTPTMTPNVVTIITPTPVVFAIVTPAQTATPVVVDGDVKKRPAGRGIKWWLLLAMAVIVLTCLGLLAKLIHRVRQSPRRSKNWGAFTIEADDGENDSAAVDDKVRDYDLAEPSPIVAGSGEECALRLHGAGVCERHCEFAAVDIGFGRRAARVRPLDGAVLYNGQTISSNGVILADGDVLHLGSLRLGLPEPRSVVDTSRFFQFSGVCPVEGAISSLC